jgi:glycosyltransferase involved in cell wall biosynthesis
MADPNRFEVDLIAGKLTGEEGSLEDEVENAGIPILRIPSLQREISPFQDYKAYRELAALFREKQYDIVHTHTSKAGIAGRWAAKKLKVPIIVHTPHGNIFDGYFSKGKTAVFKIIERKAAAWSDRLIELTSNGVDEYLQEGIGEPNQFAVIHSGIDLSPYESAIARREETRTKLGVLPDEVLIGGVGRLEPVKGFSYLIEAATTFLNELPQSKCIHAGIGSQADELTNAAAEWGDRFQFLGLRHDIPDLMAAMDVLVVPSLNEGMGRVILEAGAAQTPCIGTRVGGIPDVIQDGKTGLIVPAKDSRTLADAVSALGNDPELRMAMGIAAREFVVPEFGLDTMVEHIENLYEELIKEKNLDPGR